MYLDNEGCLLIHLPLPAAPISGGREIENSVAGRRRENRSAGTACWTTWPVSHRCAIERYRRQFDRCGWTISMNRERRLHDWYRRCAKEFRNHHRLLCQQQHRTDEDRTPPRPTPPTTAREYRPAEARTGASLRSLPPSSVVCSQW